MNWQDAVALGTTMIAGLGGGGAIVLGLSGFLGRLWADRALEKDRHEYAELRAKLEGDLHNASQYLQAELDKFGFIHKLRTEGEFQRLSTLWKNFANLSFAFNGLPHIGMKLSPGDLEERKQYEWDRRKEFNIALTNAQQVFYEEMVFIPKGIADIAKTTLEIGLRDQRKYILMYQEGE